ncbi:MAG: Rrf2 family transcriptional regulator [Coriobacteriaceae bacterium]|nr:Rrf2 family transcriptional regulator [Coriobacteriaceae bacterium]
MKISTKGRYALRLMIYIAEKDEGSVTTLREVSEAQAISVKYLEQLVSSLTAAGLLAGHRGARGGYSLKRPAEEITAGDIIRASEGSTAPVACLEDDFGVCPRQDVCETLEFWKGLDDVIDGYLDGVTLAMLAGQSRAAKARATEWVPVLAENPC